MKTNGHFLQLDINGINPVINYHTKRRKLFLAAFLVFLFFVIINTTTSYAGLFKPEDVYSWYYDTYGPGNLSNIENIVFMNMGRFFDAFSPVYDSLVVFSIFLMLIYFMTDVVTRATSMMVNVDYIAQSMLKILIAIMLINSGLEICKGIIAIANSLMNKVVSSVNYTEILKTSSDESVVINGFDWEQMWISINDMDFGAQLGAWVGTLFPRLLMSLGQLVIYVFGWSRTLEIVIRTLIAGPAMADMFSDHGKQGAFRYLKKYLAVCLVGVLYLLIGYAANMLPSIVLNFTGTITSPAEIPQGYTMAFIAAQFVAIAAMARAPRWADDIMGVH